MEGKEGLREGKKGRRGKGNEKGRKGFGGKRLGCWG